MKKAEFPLGAQKESFFWNDETIVAQPLLETGLPVSLHVEGQEILVRYEILDGFSGAIFYANNAAEAMYLGNALAVFQNGIED